ncbi:hypothetical protein [Lentzea terrae]|uniref:hypothetical protein n=1 Tax=Lentzea terrae TaxID=2200761 RepID=UPI00130020BD|nr:hypothetical protein [Lentzea terrae]
MTGSVNDGAVRRAGGCSAPLFVLGYLVITGLAGTAGAVFNRKRTPDDFPTG